MNLSRWRQERGLTQQQLADIIGTYRGSRLDQPQISHWERGAAMSRSTKAVIERALAEWDAANPKAKRRAS